MKKIIFFFLVLIIAVISAIVWNHYQNKEKYEFLIDEYMVDLASKTKTSSCFYDNKYFGKYYEYVYAWVSERCYHQEENKIVIDSSSSLAYRFYLEGDEIKSFENPEEGDEYEESMEKLFPLIVRMKMNNFSNNKTSMMFDAIDTKAQKFFNLTEFTHESESYNSMFGSITNIEVEESTDKIKKIATINNRKIYGRKENIYVYDKNGEKYELLYALDDNFISLDQIENYLVYESECDSDAKIKETKKDDASIYESDNFTIIVCQKSGESTDIYFGDKSLKYKETYCE